MVVLAVIFFIYVRPISFEFVQRRAMSKEYKHRLELVPSDAIMISGSQTIAVHYWAAIGDGKWKTIGTGGGWPGDKLFSTIDNASLARATCFYRRRSALVAAVQLAARRDPDDCRTGRSL